MSTFVTPINLKAMTFDSAKEVIARKNGKKSWDDWGRECSEPYGRSIPAQYVEEAAMLVINSLNREIKDLEAKAEHWRNGGNLP